MFSLCSFVNRDFLRNTKEDCEDGFRSGKGALEIARHTQYPNAPKFRGPRNKRETAGLSQASVLFRELKKLVVGHQLPGRVYRVERRCGADMFGIKSRQRKAFRQRAHRPFLREPFIDLDRPAGQPFVIFDRVGINLLPQSGSLTYGYCNGFNWITL